MQLGHGVRYTVAVARPKRRSQRAINVIYSSLGTPAGVHRPVESTPEMSDVRLFPKYCVVLYCVVFMAQISVSTSYFVSTLLNARCSSSFCNTFHVSFNLVDTWSIMGESGSSNCKSAEFRVHNCWIRGRSIASANNN